MHISIVSKSNKHLFDVDIKGKTTTVAELKSLIFQTPKSRRLHPTRQRLTFASVPLSDDAQTLGHYGIGEGSTVTLKDLGPQVSWTTVFLTEYFGPLAIHLFFYFLGDTFVYGKSSRLGNTALERHNPVQTMTCLLVSAHFIKREFETLCVHRFSHATMPLLNIFKNSFHYWILSGLIPAYFVYAPNYTPTFNAPEPGSFGYYALVALFMFAELSNFSTHITLRNLRPPGTRVRNIPYGYGFTWVSCPNYFFEAIAWIRYVF